MLPQKKLLGVNTSQRHSQLSKGTVTSREAGDLPWGGPSPACIIPWDLGMGWWWGRGRRVMPTVSQVYSFFSPSQRVSAETTRNCWGPWVAALQLCPAAWGD